MRALSVRLFLAFSAVITLALLSVGLALLLLLRNSPLIDRTTVTRLNEAARGVAQQPAPGPGAAALTDYLTRIAAGYDLRVVILDAGGQPVLDSQPQASPLRFNLRAAQASAQIANARQGRARDEAGTLWTFVARPFGANRFLALALPQPPYPLLDFFLRDLLGPLAQAGLLAAAAALVLAVLISRSIARPLQQMAAVAQGIAAGDYARGAPVSGPDEVRQLGQALNQMGAKIQATQQAQQDFLGNISHELKTPLTSIQGFAQAIQDGAAASPEAVQRSARIIFEEADRMRRLVEDLLELTRLDAGLRALNRQAVDVGLLLAAVTEKFQPRAQAKQITLAAELAPQLPIIKGDPDRLAQVFTNLVDNALKHTPAGGRVLVNASVTADGLQAAVADTGAGIPAEDLGRVFERFYQVDKSRARPGGVGLGLAITKEIVQAHRGSIRAESVVGLGTRFTVTLPAAWPEDSTVAGRRRAGR
ncbi:MAG: HAMP domain-containing protein [Anaerolineales bacterium]|nr:HAMP domain-containing protein [Anaerolineales bacterium]